MKTVQLFFASVLLSGMMVGAWAKGGITLSNTVQKVQYFTNEQGETGGRLIEAAQVVPGDELAYTITFENVSEGVTVNAGSVVITNPIPPQVIYLDGTAFGSGTTISYSADGGSLFGTPDQLLITDENGELRIADPSEYTHIRWVFESGLELGQRGSVSFRGRLR